MKEFNFEVYLFPILLLRMLKFDKTYYDLLQTVRVPIQQNTSQ